LHVGALSLASLSSVQPVISGGLVFLAILRAVLRLLSRAPAIVRPARHRGRTGVLGLTAAPSAREHALPAALIAVESTVIAISGALICASVRLERLHLREGIFLAAAAGALFGTSDIAIKHLVHPALHLTNSTLPALTNASRYQRGALIGSSASARSMSSAVLSS
jgi:hypothetical protein